MREIKFRAWDKVSEKMCDVAELYKVGGVRLDVYDEIRKRIYQVDRADVPVMQYTGLKDKSGKEIYSGDIVKDERGNIGVLDDVEYGTWFMWLHEYKDFSRGMQVVIAESTGDMQTASFLTGTEVIGNIYENPELLESK